MSEFAIEVEGGKSVRLKTAGKYCDRNIVVTATGGGGGDTDAAYEQGVADGKQAEYDRFWDAYQQNGNRTSYYYGFGNRGWTDETFNPKYKIIATGDAGGAFAYSQITAPLTAEMVDFSGATNLSSAFTNTKFKEIELIDASSNSQTLSYTFAKSEVEKIGLLVLSEKTRVNNTTFQHMSKLSYIRIQGTLSQSFGMANSPLDRDSIKNVVGSMSGTATGQTATFNKTAVNAAFSTDEWNALAATKPNWTITLA